MPQQPLRHKSKSSSSSWLLGADLRGDVTSYIIWFTVGDGLITPVGTINARCRARPGDNSPLDKSRASNREVANESVFPSSSNPTSLETVSCSKPHNSKFESPAYRSFETPSTKLITHGSTLMASRCTSQGTFSTNARMNRVREYFTANI